MAKQQGEYVAKLLSKGKGTPGKPITGFKGFRYGHKGSLAYVGRDKAVMDVPTIGPVFGYTAGLALPLDTHPATPVGPAAGAEPVL